MQVALNDYQSQITQLRFGKRVGTSIYFHEECLDDLPPGIASLADAAKEAAYSNNFTFNVYKLDTRAPLISLLNYPDFFEEAFPTLSSSASWELGSRFINTRSYAETGNRPILHRKELLLPSSHERLDEFASLTEAAEQIGLFEDASRIGRYDFWSSLLDKMDVKVVGHSIRRSDGQPIEITDPKKTVLRYRTALKRNRLSVPVQLLYTHEILDSEKTFFDYGCGHGDDVRKLAELGIDSSGWDPHFLPKEPKVRANIVNLGYVVNVIEDPLEREQVIADAFKYATDVLVVSALVGTPSYSKLVQSYKDGVITSTGTFQRYFQQHELADLIERSVNVVPIAVARGVLFVFKNQELEQAHLTRSFSRRRKASSRTTITELGQLNEGALSQVEFYWERCVELARPAARSEIEGCDELFKYFPSARKAHELIASERQGTRFEVARHDRVDEMLVKFALAQFGRRLFFKNFPDSLKRDVEYHFGRYSTLIEASKLLLYSISDRDALLAACVDASDNGIGYLLDDHSLQVHMKLVDRLAPILRVYVGCAGILYGEWAQIDLVKIHIQSGKVSFMGYDDFEGRPVPDLLERVKVKMWEREVEFFDYIGHFVPTPLFMKSLFIDESFECFEEQSVFDKALMRTQLFDFARDNVSKAEFYEALERTGYRIEGYKLEQIT